MRLTRPTFGPPTRRRWYRAFATLFLTVAALILGLYTWFAWDQAANGGEADAIVVGVDHNQTGDLLAGAFATEDGQRVETNFREFSGDHEVGDTVRVRYVPRVPRIARQTDEPVADPMFFGLGASFLVLGNRHGRARLGVRQ